MARLAPTTVAVALAVLVAQRAIAADIVLESTAAGDRVKVQLNKRSHNPGAHSIQYFAKHSAIAFTPGAGAIDDPVANGASAVVFSATDCQCVALSAVPGVTPGWTPVPASGTPTKYKWQDDLTRSTAQVRAGKIKLKKKGSITYGLDTVPQGEVEVQVAFGSSTDRFCSRFTAPSSTTNDSDTKYKASETVAIGACSDVPAHSAVRSSPSGAAPEPATASSPIPTARRSTRAETSSWPSTATTACRSSRTRGASS